jgi:DNA repair protein RadC
LPKKKENEIRVVNIRLVKEPSLYSDKPINNPDDVLEAVAGELK